MDFEHYLNDDAARTVLPFVPVEVHVMHFSVSDNSNLNSLVRATIKHVYH